MACIDPAPPALTTENLKCGATVYTISSYVTGNPVSSAPAGALQGEICCGAERGRVVNGTGIGWVPTCVCELGYLHGPRRTCEYADPDDSATWARLGISGVVSYRDDWMTLA